MKVEKELKKAQIMADFQDQNDSSLLNKDEIKKLNNEISSLNREILKYREKKTYMKREIDKLNKKLETTEEKYEIKLDSKT